MDQDKFNEWLESEATRVVFKYLKDSNKQQSELIAEAIIHGNILDETEQLRIATECFTLERVTQITFEEIQEFYTEE